MMSDIRKVSGGTSTVGKCLRNFLIPCFGSDCEWEWRNKPQTVRVFSCARNIQLLALQIIALWSVNKIFPESYDFAARRDRVDKWE
jgi:hypothetical protein